jgi:O-antigen ligase
VKPSVYSSPARLGIVTLTLVAVAWGGTSDLWQQAVLVLLAAVLLLVAPPRRPLGKWPHLLFPALFILALAAFLPAAWSSMPPWRRHLHDLDTILQVPLPGTRTPQPWLTAQACCQLFAGLVWAYYVLSQVWSSERRVQAAQLIVTVVAALAALATAAFCLGFHVPTWDQPENRGWFPNRNHTADVLAVCGVINYALIYDRLRKGRATAYLWFVTLILIFAGLVVSYSRAGILMFFGGILLWHLWPTEREKRRRSSVKWVTLSASLGFVMLALFFLFGGDTLARFEGPAAESMHDDTYRIAIQEDALRFSLQSPVFGVGLGNFEPLFASAREASANANRAIHPESDWLWAACELGWLAPVILVGGIVWWLRECLPFRARPGESLRRGFTMAGLLFLLHGFIDVAGHHFGSLWMGILVLSLARSDRIASPRSLALPVIFRGLAVALLLIGGWWLGSTFGVPLPPTTATLDRLAALRDRAIAANRLPEVVELADEALRISPLDWHLYYQRGYAETFQAGRLARAGADFLVARNLQSKWVKPCFDEGAAWLAADQPDLCLNAWQEALDRATPQETPELYRRMAELSAANDQVHAGLLALAAGKLDYQLIFLAYATPDEVKALIADILASHPDLQGLDAAQREKLFANWRTHGDRAGLVAQLKAHPAWQDAGWPFLAEWDADQQDFQDAWQLVARHVSPPQLPAPPPHAALDDLQRAFYEQDENLAAGIMLALAQRQAGQTDSALATLRTLEKLKNCPKYVFFLEAQLWAAKQQWELAWQAWSNFQQTPS